MVIMERKLADYAQKSNTAACKETPVDKTLIIKAINRNNIRFLIITPKFIFVSLL